MGLTEADFILREAMGTGWTRLRDPGQLLGDFTRNACPYFVPWEQEVSPL